jgi:hypothetical protein
MKKIYLILAGLMALMIPIWVFIVAPRIIWRIPPEWRQSVKCIGYQSWPDSATNKWTKEESVLYEREKSVIKREKNRGAIKDSYVTKEPLTGKITWEYAPVYEVDLKTGMHLEGKDWQGYYYEFPLQTQKKAYTLTREYYKKLPFYFVKEEVIEGLKTYLFEFKGSAEYTACYAGTEQYPGIIPPKGQEIRSSESFTIKYWVEPVSGQIVAIEEDCLDGDWIVDAKTGQKIAPVLIWGGKTTGDAVLRLADSARKRKLEIALKEMYIPLGFALLALVLAMLGRGVFTLSQKAKSDRR